MPTVYANPGNVLKMQTMNGTIIQFCEIPIGGGMVDINCMVKEHGENETFDMTASITKDQTSGLTVRQIQIAWRGENEATYEVIYEWLT